MPSANMPLCLDLRGLKCPLPVLKTRAALRGMKAGEILRVQTTDPMSVIDIPHLVSQLGDRLLDQAEEGTGMRFEIMKGVANLID